MQPQPEDDHVQASCDGTHLLRKHRLPFTGPVSASLPYICTKCTLGSTLPVLSEGMYSMQVVCMFNHVKEDLKGLNE